MTGSAPSSGTNTGTDLETVDSGTVGKHPVKNGIWYCVEILRNLEATRTFNATNRTFVSLLKGEPRNPEIECPVYGHPAHDGHHYYFTPNASTQYARFIRFWRGTEVPEPRHLKMMSRII